MAKRRKMTKKKMKNIYKVVTFVIVLAILAGAYFFGLDDIIFGEDPGDRGNAPVEGELWVHFIDVGQADCILVMSGDEVMLIDTGDTDNDYTEKIIDYVQEFNITEIDYLVLTHPDSDHIGGAPEVIDTFVIKNCIMPDYAKTTKIYENTITALENQEGVNVIESVPGYEFTVGEAACTVLAPLKAYDDANEISAVIRLDFGERSVLFTGDAEKDSEADMAAQYSAAELKVDVLKSGHHGSSTSSSPEFLNKVDPDYAVISSGVGNSYGHPHDETIERYKQYGITVYRTDTHGTVVLKIADGEITFATEK
jgi:competence protein ComEC